MRLKSRTIVVGLDFSKLSERAFRQAYELLPFLPLPKFTRFS